MAAVNIPDAIRQRVYMALDGHCFYCGSALHKFGEPGPRSLMFVCDHVMPRSRGGCDSENNLVAACDGCNVLKKNRSLEEFRRYVFDRWGASVFWGDLHKPGLRQRDWLLLSYRPVHLVRV